MTERTTYACGCANALDPATGALRCVGKCRKHAAERREPAALGAAYYEELGVLRGGRLAGAVHAAELEEALGPFPTAFGREEWRVAWELGCGVSPYVEAVRAAGWRYTGLEASRWAADWMTDTHHVGVVCADFDDPTLCDGTDIGLILAAHVLEHLPDAPAAVRRCARMLAPGGELWVIVPDDSDPVNPDHLWTFDADSLARCLEGAGLKVVKVAVFRRIRRERFVYARARKS